MVFRTLGWLMGPRGKEEKEDSLELKQNPQWLGSWQGTPVCSESRCGAAACHRTHGFRSAPPGPPEVEGSHEQLSVPFPFHLPLAVGPQRGRTVVFLWPRVTHSRCRG